MSHKNNLCTVKYVSGGLGPGAYVFSCGAFKTFYSNQGKFCPHCGKKIIRDKKKVIN